MLYICHHVQTSVSVLFRHLDRFIAFGLCFLIILVVVIINNLRTKCCCTETAPKKIMKAKPRFVSKHEFC